MAFHEYRPYQEEAINRAVERFNKKKPPGIMALATGSGKSHIIAGITQKLNVPTLILQPNQEIILQNYEKYTQRGYSAGIWSHSAGRKDLDNVVFATIQSIKDYGLFGDYKNVIVDEADVVNARNTDSLYMKLFNAIQPNSITGLTATPYRIITRYTETLPGSIIAMGMVEVLPHIKPYFFKHLFYKKELAELIEENYLCPIKYIQVAQQSTENLLKLNTLGTDFTPESLEKDASEKKSLLYKTIKHCLDNHKKTLVFMPGIGSATRLYQELQDFGVPCGLVTSNTSPNERKEVIADFRANRFKIMVNMAVFTVGADFPDCDSLILNRSIISPRLYYQIGGRILRKDPENPNKVAHFYDLTKTTKRLGRIEDIRLIKDPNGWRNVLIHRPLYAESFRQLSNKPLYSYKI